MCAGSSLWAINLLWSKRGYASDVVAANLLAASSDVLGDVFNIGGGSMISVNLLIRKTEVITGKKAKLEYVAAQKGDVSHTLADTAKTREILHWQPAVKIEEGLQRYLGDSGIQ